MYLWGNEKLYDNEFANLISLTDSKKDIDGTVLLGHGYSVSTLKETARDGFVIAAACDSDEPAYACSEIPYDEFVYRYIDGHAR